MTDSIGRIVILVPTYNSAHFITAALDSIERQDVALDSRLSVQVADDASTDETLALVQRPPGRFVVEVTRSLRNVGERRNVNQAIQALRADGVDWVVILHSDDMAKPHWLRMLMERIDVCDDSVATICSSWDNLFPDGTIVAGEDDLNRSSELVPGGVEAVRGTLRRGCWWHISGCAIRTRAFADVGLFDPDLPQIGDLEWLLRCLGKGWAVEYIPRTLIVYRQHPQSVSSESFAKSRDIIENLTLARRYSGVMTLAQVIEFHVARTGTVLLRIVRSLTQRRFRRTAHLAGVMGRIGINMCLTLGKVSA